MKHRHPALNPLPLPATLVSAAAHEAALRCASTLNRARREIALPAPLRRPLSAIHAEARSALRTAHSLAQMGGQVTMPATTATTCYGWEIDDNHRPHLRPRRP